VELQSFIEVLIATPVLARSLEAAIMSNLQPESAVDEQSSIAFEILSVADYKSVATTERSWEH